MHENRETSGVPRPVQDRGRSEKAQSRTSGVHAPEESDRTIVPMNQSNKEDLSSAEAREGRVRAKENIVQSSTSPTQSGERVSQGLHGVREAAKGRRKERFTALLHHLSVGLLRDSFYALKRQAAPGVDGVTWREYEDGLEGRIGDLHSRVHRGAYRAQPSRRVYIPKADGRQRPLGIAALEDKVVQQAVVTILNQIYEMDFKGFSYGFRPGRNPHQALDALTVGIQGKRVSWVLDADIRGFLETASHCPLIHENYSNSSGCCSTTLIRKPLRRPSVTRTASSSPRVTRCNTVCRETPSFIVVSNIGRYSGGACATMRERISSLMRICHGAPGVTCSPAMKPSFSQRCIVDVFIPRICAALRIETSPPVGGSAGGW